MWSMVVTQIMLAYEVIFASNNFRSFPPPDLDADCTSILSIGTVMYTAFREGMWLLVWTFVFIVVARIGR
jgi:hypothetical protein